MDAPSPFREIAGGLRVTVRLTPRGGRDAIDGPEQLADGTMVLKARVKVPPEDGAANAALVALLASAFGVAKKDAALVQGHKSRLKSVDIKGPLDQLLGKARALLPLAVLLVLAMPFTARAQDLDAMIRSLSCLDRQAYFKTGAALMRATQDRDKVAQMVRVYRQALALGVDGCTTPDNFLIRRSVGMLNSINRQIGLADASLPPFAQE